MKRVVAVLGVAVAGSQAGHLLAYQLRFGAAAQQVQSTGSHAYFPTVVRTMLGAIALTLIVSMLLIGLARLVSGRRIERESAPSILRLLAALYTLQLALFIVQETIEGSSAGQLFMWGLLGQLPVALAGALALRWLLARLGPALARIRQRCEMVLEARVFSTVLVPASAHVFVPAAPAMGPLTRRGPPSF